MSKTVKIKKNNNKKLDNDKKLFNERLKKMKVLTCFNNSSFFGHKSNVLKSGICKYYRRNEHQKFIWCVIEMLLFNQHPDGKSIVTNLLNRLRILLMEDMSFHEVDRALLGFQKLDEFESSDRTECYKIYEFCKIVLDGSKGRIVSYSNTWWRFHPDLELDKDIELNKVLKYKKKGDSDELLKLGEHLINFAELKEEKILRIYMEMVRIENKQGKRFRRTDAPYLYFEILKDFCDNEHLELLFPYILTMFNRKSMKERYAFGIWLGLLILKRDEIEYGKDVDFNISEKKYNSYLLKRTNIEMDDYVINDWHVDKSVSISQFATNGAYVVNEDYKHFGKEKFLKYKQKYIDSKKEIAEKENESKSTKSTVSKSTKSTVSKSTKSTVSKSKDTVNFIDFKEFTGVKVLEDVVCGGKVCCIKLNYKGKPYILKEMRLSMNEGRDYIFVDKMKDVFGLIDLKMKRIKSNSALTKKNTKKISFIGNWEWTNKEVIYCMMKYYPNIGDIGKNKQFLENQDCFKELFKIRLFDGLFRSSDNILRNILITEDKKLISIDEGDIYGKRKTIFNQRDWCRNNVNKEIIDEILLEFDLPNKIELVREKLEYYGFSQYIEEMKERFINYKEIVYEELNL
jgi:hypothetical protein